MKLHKGRLALLMLAAIVVWLVGRILISQALPPKYAYTITKIDRNTGQVERLYRPGEKEAEANTALTMRVLTFGVIAAFVITVIIGTRPSRWLRAGTEQVTDVALVPGESTIAPLPTHVTVDVPDQASD